MENTTQLRLDQNIALWRSELASSGVLGNEDLDELESHLLDEIEQLTSFPLSEREAFMVAKDRIGSHAELSSTYVKSKSLWSLFKSRYTLYLQAVLVLIIISLTSRIVEFGTILTIGFFELPMSWGNYLYSGLLVILLGALFLWFRLMSSKARQQYQKISFTGHLTIITLVVVLLAVLFGIQFGGLPIQLELLSIFFIRQYIWAIGMLIILVTSIIYSIGHYKTQTTH